ncbi:hypothetical protein [Aquipuribacter hungaricus]|uniref:PKD domain-containing protein n=1 Tax=Aquipuribacter hungaricus TaxID=545624 RepID=A0ABV7WFC0_9MICO
MKDKQLLSHKLTVRSLVAVVAATLVLLVLPASASAAPQPDGNGGGRIDGNNDGDSIVIDGGSGNGGGGTNGGGSSPIAAAPTLVTVTRYTFACPGNSYLVDPPINLSCEAAVQNCTVNVTDRLYLRWTTSIMSNEAVPPPGGGWSLDGALCLSPAVAEAPAPQPVVTLADFRRLPLPASQAAIQPAGGEALIRMRTNAYVDPVSTGQQTFDITLLGTPVRVRATPASYTWDYGDGSAPVTTTDPGAPYPDLTTWHEYSDPGEVAITLTTSYTGEYSVAGGPWIAIPGTAEVDSPPQPLRLLTSSNRLTG